MGNSFTPVRGRQVIQEDDEVNLKDSQEDLDRLLSFKNEKSAQSLGLSDTKTTPNKSELIEIEENNEMIDIKDEGQDQS